MDGECGEYVGVGCGEDRGHGGSSGYPGDVDAGGVNSPVRGVLDGLDDADNGGGFTSASALMGGEKPVPAEIVIVVFDLLRIDDYTVMLFGTVVHAGCGGEVEGGLCTAVEHDDEGNGGSGLICFGGVDEIWAISGRVAVGKLLPHRTPDERHVRG